jgi:hypothetical protein
MQCLNCGGQLEWAGGGQYARCMRDLSLFSQENGQLTPVVVQAPGGGFNPEFNNIFAQNLGFGPPPPGAAPMPPPGGGGNPYGAPPGGGFGGPQPNHDVGAGRFDLGNGQQLRVKINGQTPDNFVKNKISGAIWGLIITAIIVGLFILIGAGFAIYIYVVAKDATTQAAAGGVGGTPVAATWDGKTPLDCSGNNMMAITNVNATAPINASGNCKLTLTNVTVVVSGTALTAGGNATVTMAGGVLQGGKDSIDASANAKVILNAVVTKGNKQKTGNAMIIGG